MFRDFTMSLYLNPNQNIALRILANNNEELNKYYSFNNFYENIKNDYYYCDDYNNEYYNDDYNYNNDIDFNEDCNYINYN